VQEPIREIRVSEYKTDRFSVYVNAQVEENGDLYVNAEHIGEAPGYEFEDSVLVKKGDKEAVLRGLFEERCKNVSGAIAWMDAQGIPRQPVKPWRLKSLLQANPEYRDTILLLLLKGRFTDLSDFSRWLESKRIPAQFHSES
jgi:hypothetical protein